MERDNRHAGLNRIKWCIFPVVYFYSGVDTYIRFAPILALVGVGVNRIGKDYLTFSQYISGMRVYCALLTVNDSNCE